MAERIAARARGGFYVNQFGNPANPLAHETTTGPEIWAQTERKAGRGRVRRRLGRHASPACSRYFARMAPEVEMVLADPAGSVLAEYVRTGQIGQAGSWLVEGIGEDFLPPIADLSRVKRAYTISRRGELHDGARPLLKQEGILAGSSSGTLVAAALRYCREQHDAQARRHLRLRQRQQVPVEDVQRLLDARSGLPGARHRRATCAT